MALCRLRFTSKHPSAPAGSCSISLTHFRQLLSLLPALQLLIHPTSYQIYPIFTISSQQIVCLYYTAASVKNPHKLPKKRSDKTSFFTLVPCSFSRLLLYYSRKPPTRVQVTLLATVTQAAPDSLGRTWAPAACIPAFSFSRLGAMSNCKPFEIYQQLFDSGYAAEKMEKHSR